MAKHRDEWVCETQEEFLVTRVPFGKVAALVGPFQMLGRVSCGAVTCEEWERAAGGSFLGAEDQDMQANALRNKSVSSFQRNAKPDLRSREVKPNCMAENTVQTRRMWSN